METIKQSEVTKEEALDTWNSPRSTEQLLGFIARREAALEAVEL